MAKTCHAVGVAVAGVILGWPFSVLAFLNIGWSLYSLTKRFNQTFLSGAMTTLLLLVLSLLVDYSYYGRSRSSVLN